ncbi:hypothetical protein BOTCAL_0046g00240 [Botryotinia calthae]|uniref:Uncharacterized protein n=1 Tax=Botryotinia calthae TaxID=38488 RepID=A0A4Y8DBT6_9HELO|nr:hypothetical protein BOTCAL_0046g00240 [Botryotinia calthae]
MSSYPRIDRTLQLVNFRAYYEVVDCDILRPSYPLEWLHQLEKNKLIPEIIAVIDEDQYSQLQKGWKKEEEFSGKKGDGGVSSGSEYPLDRALVSSPKMEEYRI